MTVHDVLRRQVKIIVPKPSLVVFRLAVVRWWLVLFDVCLGLFCQAAHHFYVSYGLVTVLGV